MVLKRKKTRKTLKQTRQKKKAKQVSNREYKSTVFTTYFGVPERAAELYMALESERAALDRAEASGENSDEEILNEEIKPEDIVFETLQGVIYLARKNDMAFTVKKKILVIGEHQSTINRNMPLRSAIYYGRTMERLVPPNGLYKSKEISIPTPEFYVFYNGKSSQPLEQNLYLSESYLEKTDNPMLELKVKVININLPQAHPILERCRSLYEYSWFIQRIREYLEEENSRDAAIASAMEDCVRAGIMVEFIKEHGSEVRNMLFGEFNLETAREVWEEEAREEGREEGRREGREEGVSDGRILKVIEQVCKKLQRNKSPETIAEELEEDYDEIVKICHAVKETGAGYDSNKIYAWMESKKE